MSVPGRTGTALRPVCATVLVVAALALAGCGSSPSVNTEATTPLPTSLYVDWDYYDWLLDRFIMINVRDFVLMHGQRVPKPHLDYKAAVTYSAEWDSISLVGFLSLSTAEQTARRRDAADHHEKARRIVLGTVGYYRGAADRGMMPNLSTVEMVLPPQGAETAVTAAIKQLVRAVGTDPGSAGAWHDLAYFTRIAGDRTRHQKALASCLAALDMLPEASRVGDDARRLRRDVLLDLAWLARDLGQPAVTLAYLDHVRPWLDAPGREREERNYEAKLLRGLALADQGEWLAAVSEARDLPRLKVVTRTLSGGWTSDELRWSMSAPHFLTLGFDRAAWPTQESDFGRRWIKALAGAPTGEAAHVLWTLGSPPTHLEFPARIASRYWQDQGLLYARAGRYQTAHNCYEWAAMYHPYSVFFPLRGRQESSSSVSQGYFLGYGTFFLCGDREAYDRDLKTFIAERSRDSSPTAVEFD